MPDDTNYQDYYASQGLVFDPNQNQYVRPTNDTTSTPDFTYTQPSSPADIAAYRLSKGVKRENPLPVQDDRSIAANWFSGPQNPERPSYVMEPSLLEAQGGMQLPPGVVQDATGALTYKDTGELVPIARRPALLPFTATPEGFKFVTPKVLDLVGNVVAPLGAGRVPLQAGEAVLGSGAVRTIQNELSPIALKAKEHFGITYNPKEAGYVLPDGSMLDLSGRHQDLHTYQRINNRNIPKPNQPDYMRDARNVDHREVGDLIENPASGFEAMQQFMNEAKAIRNMPGNGFDITFVPTDKQLQKIISGHNSSYRGEPLKVDISDPKTGDNIASKSFDKPNVENIKKFIDENSAKLLSDTRPQVADATGHALEKAPPFYSALERAVTNAKVEKAGAEQWLGYLRNQPGVKAEELSTVLQELPKGQITKSELQNIVNQNKVQLKETIKGESNYYIPQYKDTFARNLEMFKDLPINDAGDVMLAIKHNPAFKETVKGKNPIEILDALDEARSLPNFDNIAGKSFDTKEEAEAAIKQAKAESHLDIKKKNEFQDTKYSQYQLPGGENYKEMLLQLPYEKLNVKSFKDFKAENNLEHESHTVAANQYENYLNSEYIKPDVYRSSHWDEPNVLAHIRMNDRNIEGNKTLHAEEFQSDLHQAGRDYGYKGEIDKLAEPFSKVERKITESNDEAVMGEPNLKKALELAVEKKIITKEEAQIYNRFVQVEAGESAGKTVPDFPFKKNWEELAIKRFIRHAVENGYDAVSWTPGEAQALRYQNEIRQKIKSIEWEPRPEGYELTRAKELANPQRRVYIKPSEGGEIALTLDKNGKIIAGKNEFKGKTLDEVLGKDFAKQIMEKDNGSIDAKGYVMGAEGMKQAYDKRAVDIMNAIGKKYGAKVEQKELPSPHKVMRAGPEDWRVVNAETNQGFPRTFKTKELAQEYADSKGKKSIHYMALTPQLKQKALQEGFPLFSSTPITVPVDYVPEFKKRYSLKPVSHNPFE